MKASKTSFKPVYNNRNLFAKSPLLTPLIRRQLRQIHSSSKAQIRFHKWVLIKAGPNVCSMTIYYTITFHNVECSLFLY